MDDCVICWKHRCSFARCKYCDCCLCKECMTRMLKIYKNGNEYLRKCPNCRSDLNWARKKNGTIIEFPEFNYQVLDLNPNPLRPILNIYYILLNVTGMVFMFFMLCKLLTTMHFEDKGILLFLCFFCFIVLVR